MEVEVETAASAHDFFQSLDPAARTLPALLEAVAHDLVARLDLVRAELSIEGLDTPIAVPAAKRPRTGGERRRHGAPLFGSLDEAVHEAEWFETPPPGPVADPAAARPARRPAALTLPLRHGDGAPVGEMRLEWRGEDEKRRAPATWLQEVARQCACLVRRYEAQAWSARRLGEPMLLIGMSRAVRELEAFVERVAQSKLPVLLDGEFGTEKPLLAMTIHCLSPRREAPFVEVNCAEPGDSPEQWFREAEGGTLFLSDVDELSPLFQGRLPLYMRSHMGQWLGTLAAADVRLIASTTADLEARVAAGQFSRRLLAELDVLRATVPPLRERPGDIERLALAALERRGFSADDKSTEALIAICRAYSWPQNVVELERVIARLAVMTDTRPIRREDVLLHAPWIAEAPSLAPVARPAQPASPPADKPAAPPSATGDPDRWVRCVIERDATAMAGLHASLRRALLYLGENYAEPVSLEQLTRQVHVSPSHLSFLFRTELQTSFKALLLRVRIHKAQEILAQDPRRQITEVALSVGFADLSHFEKSFRRVVGLSPREHRSRAALGGSKQASAP